MVLALMTLFFVLAQPPPDSHFIVGEAYYDGTIPADGANVTVINERTSEKLYDIVGPSGNSGISGYYVVDLADLPTGYRDGDGILVIINGTGDYSSWTGTNSTTVDNATASQIVNVILSSIHDTTPPETTITSGPSGTITYNDVTFTWSGSDDITPTPNLLYSYKLEGYDSSWSPWVSDTS
ncbi:MAG: hypothetical protein FE048_04135, partial [Thermoplasmata archaeon]